MLKNITFIFDDDTEVVMIGDADKIAELIKGRLDIKGLVIHEDRYIPSGNGWDIDALRKIMKARSD